MINYILYLLFFIPTSFASENCTQISMDVATVKGLIEYHASINLHGASIEASACRSDMDVVIVAGSDSRGSEAVLAVKEIVSYHLGEDVRLIDAVNEERGDSLAVIFRPRP